MMTSEGGMPFDAYLYRGISDPSVLPATNLVGRRITDHGYVATTTDHDAAESFAFPGGGRPAAVIVQINGRKGQPAIVADYEILLPRSTTFRVTFDTVVPRSGTRVIHAEIES